jgi:hypothetical protein
MKYFRIVLLLFFFISDGCIDELDVPVLHEAPRLVVDGSISDQQGPHTVKLFLSSSLDQDLDRPAYVSGASVQIRDDLGNTEELTEKATGIYETADNVKGVIGRKYQVLITTAEENKQYESDLIPLAPAGEIETVDFEFQENALNSEDPYHRKDAFSIFVNARGTPGAPNLFRWRWTGTYRIKTFPELRTRAEGGPNGNVYIPDPLPCSGYVYEQGQLIRRDTCSCCDCWLTRYSDDVTLSNNDYVVDNKFNHVPVAQIPVDNDVFYDKYHLEIEQISIPEDVYKFWKLVNIQEESSGNIFQPNVVKIRGNIRCVSDPDEEVFGIFSVSAITKKSISIRRSDIPKRLPPIDTVTYDCRVYTGGTNLKPPFW